MKKGLLLAGFVCISLLLTGCQAETKTLNCTMKEDAGGATTTSNMDVTFTGSKVENINMDIIIDYTDEYASVSNIFKETLESQKSTLEETGYEVNITSGDNFVKLTASGTSETLTSDESTGSYEKTKESLENSGYTCK